MQLKQSIKQQQTQKLAMTQELQQAIQMLQFNAQDLNKFLTSKELENPLMEVEITESDYDTPIRERNYYTSDQENNYLNQIPDKHESLFDFLLKQVHLNYRDTYLRQLVLFLVEHIDSNGYLTLTLEEACAQTGAEPIQMLDALTLIQQLDPAGVGARDLQECLLLQIERDELAPALAYLIIEEDFERFAQRDWQAIANDYQLEVREIQQISDFIQLLTPFPGAIYNSSPEPYIQPELRVKNKDQQLVVQSMKEGAPEVVFQERYYRELSSVKDKDVQKFLTEKKTEVDWIKRGIAQRGETILAVGKEIVSRQQDFFLKKGQSLQPLVMKDIADSLGVHESTISRTVNGKYLETSFGVFELKSFFATGLTSGKEGGEIATTDVKQQIEKIVKDENKQKPLSDQKIVNLLAADEIKISRRTVAKYRDELGILSSTKRKRFD